MKNIKNSFLKLSSPLQYLIMFSISIIFLFPLYWAVNSMFKFQSEYLQSPPTFYPHDFTLQSIKDAWTSQPFSRYFINSLIVTSLAVVGMTFSSALIAYGFARFEFKGKNLMFVLLLGTMMVPWDVLIIPLYQEYVFFGWIDTYLPLIVPAFFGGAFYIFLLRQFLRGIPRDFEEMARIEGANEFQIFTKIFLPIIRPQLVLVAVLYALVVWNDYLGPLVYLNTPDKFTMSIGLSLFNGAYESNPSAIMSISVIMTLPPLILFMIMQKQILESSMSSGIK